jgi:hypothetical protein
MVFDLKGRSIESRLASIEKLTLVDHPEFPRPGPKKMSTRIYCTIIVCGGLH